MKLGCGSAGRLCCGCHRPASASGARQGLAGRAMGIATTGSVLGTWIGMLALALFTPVLGEAALEDDGF